MKSRTLTALMVIISVAVLPVWCAAQEQVKPERPRQSKPSTKPAADAGDKIEPMPQPQEHDDALRRAVNNLSIQIGALNDEVGKLRRENERSSAMLELLINEERLTKLEDKLQDANDRKAQLDARDLEIQARMRNIQREVALRGGLRRDEAETAIRAELQRALEDNRAQQTVNQQRIAELNEQAAKLRARTDSLRKKVEEPEEKVDKEK
jgi:chromosome segregation ATPase